MSELFTIALFQLVALFGYSPINQPANTETAPTKTEAGGTGGWGHDITSNETTPPPTPSLDGGTGGWGHD